MAEPQRLESIRFDAPLPPPGSALRERLRFELCAARMAATEASCVAELTRAGMKPAYVGKVRRRASPRPESNPATPPTPALSRSLARDTSPKPPPPP